MLCQGEGVETANFVVATTDDASNDENSAFLPLLLEPPLFQSRVTSDRTVLVPSVQFVQHFNRFKKVDSQAGSLWARLSHISWTHHTAVLARQQGLHITH